MEYKTARPEGSTGRCRTIGLAKSIEQATREFVVGVKNRFQDQIEQDPAGFKKQIVKLLRRELPLRRGRPNDPRLDAAARLVEQGKSPKDVLRVQIPDFDEMDTYSRYLAEKGLRAALARRRRRQLAASPVTRGLARSEDRTI